MTEAQLEHFRVEHEKLQKKYDILLDFVKCQAEMLADNTAYQVLQEIGEL